MKPSLKSGLPVILALVACLQPFLLAQEPGAHIGEFEVASIKRSLSTSGVIYHSPGGRFKAEALTLLNLIGFAYDVPDDQVQGLPPWGAPDRFDIDAIAEAPEESNPARMETPIKKAMVRRLLAERFSLELKSEERIAPTYSLVQSSKGNKLERNAEKPFLIHAGRRSYVFQKATMAALAKQLSVGVRKDIGRPVIDKTGIPGEFDFKLTWGAVKPAAFDSTSSTSPAATVSDNLPSIFDALQQQLGLQLKADHAPLLFLVVTKANFPTAN